MQYDIHKIGGKVCRIYCGEHPKTLLIQPIVEREYSRWEEEVVLLTENNKALLIVAFEVSDWEKELMPWADRAVSKREGVGEHAHDTLTYIEQELLIALQSRFGVLPCILGGYSLGGLFALWASMQTNAFMGIAAASPSVWIEGWLEYVQKHRTLAQQVYMSLGNKEEFAKNKSIAQVGENLRAYHKILLSQLGDERTILEWNEGNHFHNVSARTARGFIWNLTL